MVIYAQIIETSGEIHQFVAFSHEDEAVHHKNNAPGFVFIETTHFGDPAGYEYVEGTVRGRL